jgi:hypothetical protein
MWSVHSHMHERHIARKQGARALFSHEKRTYQPTADTSSIPDHTKSCPRSSRHRRAAFCLVIGNYAARSCPNHSFRWTLVFWAAQHSEPRSFHSAQRQSPHARSLSTLSAAGIHHATHPTVRFLLYRLALGLIFVL